MIVCVEILKRTTRFKGLFIDIGKDLGIFKGSAQNFCGNCWYLVLQEESSKFSIHHIFQQWTISVHKEIASGCILWNKNKEHVNGNSSGCICIGSSIDVFPRLEKAMFLLEFDLTFYSNLGSITEIQNKLSPENSLLEVLGT